MSISKSLPPTQRRGYSSYATIAEENVSWELNLNSPRPSPPDLSFVISWHKVCVKMHCSYPHYSGLQLAYVHMRAALHISILLMQDNMYIIHMYIWIWICNMYEILHARLCWLFNSCYLISEMTSAPPITLFWYLLWSKRNLAKYESFSDGKILGHIRLWASLYCAILTFASFLKNRANYLAKVSSNGVWRRESRVRQ